jgi:hypothetical protein
MKRSSLFFIAIGFAVVIVAAVTFAIRRHSKPKPTLVARHIHQHLSPSEWEPASSLSIAYSLREHDSLASIATQRYGNQRYYEVIQVYNQIEDANMVSKGTTVRIPDISTMLIEAGFTKVAAPEMEMILCSRAKFERVKNQLSDLQNQVALRERVSLPPNVKQELLEAADDLQQATESLKRARPGVGAAPTKMIGQLETVMHIIRNLAEGSNDGSGYDIDIVQQRYALGLTNGIVWAREGFK